MSTPWDYSTTPPETINYATADAATGAPPGHSDPAAPTAAAPNSAAPLGQTTVAPGAIAFDATPAAPIAAPANVTITQLDEGALGLLGLIDSIAS